MQYPLAQRRWLSGVLTAVLFACPLASGAVRAADSDVRADDRVQLRAILTEIEAGINDQSIDRLLAVMADNVTVTWLNAEVSHGKPEVKAYYQRMVGGQGTILKKYLTSAKLGSQAKFFGDIAVADGTAADEFYPHARSVFRLNSTWSSTLAKIDGQWRIVSLHLSSNVFNNPLIAELERMLWVVGAGALVAGILLTALVGYFRRGGRMRSR